MLSDSLAVMERAIPREPADDRLRPKNSAIAISKLVQEEQENKRLKVNCEVESVRGQGIEGLRKLAELRESQKKDKAEELHQRQMSIENKKKIESLVLVCDIIRSSSNMQKRTAFESAALEAAVSTRLQISKAEALSRLRLLAEVAPEYLTVTESDGLAPCRVVHINPYCDYFKMRTALPTKLQKFQ